VTLIMELVDATTLDKRRPESHARAVKIFHQVAQGLAHMHERGFAHADIKPNNIMVTDTDDVKIIDLGQACAIGTIKKRIQGTPGYMAPEQALRQPPDTRSDLYSLGCMAYEMLTGAPPFRGETPLDLLMRQVNEPPTPPRALSPDLPAHVERALLKSLAKDPAERWPSATLFVEAIRGRVDVSHVQTISLAGRLETLAITAPSAHPEPGPKEPAPPARPRLSLRRFAVLVLLGVVLGGTAFFGLRRYAASLEATPSSPRPPAPETIEMLLAGARRALDEGDYPGALRFAELALRLQPGAPGASALADRARTAWDAETSLGLWQPSPSPSP
jgi:serine/threonine-protein kinase